MMKLKTTLILLTLLLATTLIAQDTFVRKAVIPVPAADQNLGIGNVLAGVDFDGDGKTEMYFVNDMLDQAGETYTPRMYKYEFNGTTWDSVWSTELPRTQNTWPGLAQADLDNDGKPEVVWTPAEGETTPSPARIYVFEAPGDGSDNMGVDDGAGGWKANAEWNFDIPDDNNMRAIKIVVADFDQDGTQEIALADRKGYFSMAIISVSDVPDNADGTETWTMEFNGKDVQANTLIHNGEIASPDGGFGNVVAGMDYDGDGYMEMYAVNNDWNDGPNGELIPTMYKYEYVNGAWIKRWETAIPDIPLQNTWPVLLAGDWDNDGLGEVIWCPVNNLDATNNPNPSRVVVYEASEDSSDVMGVDNGDGTYRPNAQWNMGLDDNVEMRPVGGLLTDVDGDGTLDFYFVERKSQWGWAAITVDNIPNNGDGTETWRMIDHGAEGTYLGFFNDCTVIGDKIASFGNASNLFFLKYNATTSTLDTVATQTFGNAYVLRSFKTVDIDKDGTDEVLAGIYYSEDANFPTGSVVLFTEDADTLVPHLIGSFNGMTPDHISSLEVGDIDADSLTDIVLGFKYSGKVERLEYQGGDITDPASYTSSLLDAGITADGTGQIDVLALANIDDDAADEVIYGGVPRSIDENVLDMVVGDFGDWSIGSTNWDIVSVGDGAAAIGISLGGDIYPVSYNADSAKYMLGHAQSGLNGGNGDFLSACAGDVNGDGFDEVFYAEYWGTGKVYMLMQNENGAAVSYPIADLGALGGTRITGGAAGDIDGDGNLDLIFGTRESTPHNAVYRVKYMGGDPTDANSWGAELIDQDILAAGGQIDVIHLANVDDDADLEILYTGLPRDDGYLPIVILDIQKVQAEAIADVRIDSDGDGVPDRLGEDVTIKGIVTSNSFSSSSVLIGVQDETAGIVIYQGGNDSTFFDIGTLVLVNGSVSQYKGLTEISVTSILPLGQGTMPEPIVLTPVEYNEMAEEVEGMLVTINAVTKTEDSVWPDSGSSGSFYFTDGYATFKSYLDRDVHVTDSPEPTFPVNITGIASQFSYSTPALDGYQLWPRSYDDFEQNVAAPPSKYFFFTDETRAYDGGVMEIDDSAGVYTMSWHPSVDLNGEALIYQFVILNPADNSSLVEELSDNNGADTTASPTGVDIIDLISTTGTDSITVKITLRTVSTNPAEGIISSVDTITVTFKDKATGVSEEGIIPKEFFVDQNYPNPFNPSTTIQFGLPAQAEVSLIIYDILGREVARLINNQVMNAGTYKYSFNASNLASGTYIYRLQADKKVEVKKMLLLK